MPLAQSLTSKLLENVRANLMDATNAADAQTAFGDAVRVAAVPVGGFDEAPYVIVVLGDTVDPDPDANAEWGATELTCWVVSSEMVDEYDPAAAIGSALVNQSDTLVKVVKRALLRGGPPYRESPWNASPYHDLPGVVRVQHVRTGGFETIPVPSGDESPDAPGAFALARPVTFRYLWVEV